MSEPENSHDTPIGPSKTVVLSTSSVHAVPRWPVSLRAQVVPAAAQSDAATIDATRIVFNFRIGIPLPLARDLYGLERLLVHVLVLVRVHRLLGARHTATLLDANLDERLDDDGVELGSCVRAKLAEGVLGPERDAVRSRARHRVVRVCDRDDLRGEWDLAALETVGVARAVEVLVVREDERADPLEHWHVPEEARADRRMGTHLDPLLVGELGGLREKCLRNPDLAHVVEERAQLDRRDLLCTKAELAADLDRVVHRRRRVAGEMRLLRLESTDQRADHGDMRLLEPVIRLTQELVDRAQLLVPLADLGRLRHVQAEGEPGHAERDREDEDPEEADRLVRQG